MAEVNRYEAANGVIIETTERLTQEQVDALGRQTVRELDRPVPPALLTRNWIAKTRDPIGGA